MLFFMNHGNSHTADQTGTPSNINSYSHHRIVPNFDRPHASDYTVKVIGAQRVQEPKIVAQKV